MLNHLGSEGNKKANEFAYRGPEETLKPFIKLGLPENTTRGFIKD